MDFVDSTAFRLFFVVAVGGMVTLAAAVAVVVGVLLRLRRSAAR